jgi:hypothetical protein
MKGPRIAFLLALAVAAAAAVGVQVAVGSPSEQGPGRSSPASVARPPSRAVLEGVNFVSVCRFSHRNHDDPIVFPGEPGKSHDHTFLGNTTTNADSTLESLLAGGTTCQRPGDTAAYWVPTLFAAGGEAVEPLGATIYYRRRTIAPLTAFPPGFRMIAGSSKATSAQGRQITTWSCGVESGIPPSSDIPTCPTGRGMGLRLHVRFQDCWDGRSLDSADHQSHVAYSVQGRCPRTHPVGLPAIALIVRYGIGGGDGLELASGGEYSAHADFFNAWNQQALRRLVGFCLNGLRHCGRAV